jgi:hypothetical protein
MSFERFQPNSAAPGRPRQPPPNRLLAASPPSRCGVPSSWHTTTRAESPNRTLMIEIPRTGASARARPPSTQLSLAIQNGFRGIDTACQPKHYDEAGVGAGVAASASKGLARSDLYLQTKFTSLSGQDPDRIPYDPKARLPGQVVQSIATSLKNLQTDYLDCVLLHSPMPTMALTLSVWSTRRTSSVSLLDRRDVS